MQWLSNEHQSFFMQESLGGNAKTSLVVAVADAREQIEETAQALQFGSRAMRVKVCFNLYF